MCISELLWPFLVLKLCHLSCCFSFGLLIALTSVNPNLADFLFAEGVTALPVHWGLSPYPTLMFFFFVLEHPPGCLFSFYWARSVFTWTVVAGYVCAQVLLQAGRTTACSAMVLCFYYTETQRIFLLGCTLPQWLPDWNRSVSTCIHLHPSTNLNNSMVLLETPHPLQHSAWTFSILMSDTKYVRFLPSPPEGKVYWRRILFFFFIPPTPWKDLY